MYLIKRMLEDFSVGPEEFVTREEMLELVDTYRRGALCHSDAWFKLFVVDESNGDVEQLSVSDFYEEAEEYVKSKQSVQPTE